MPHLKLITAVTRSRMGAKVLIPQVEIYSLPVKIELMPELPAQISLCASGPESIRVRVFLGAPDAPRSTEKLIDISADDIKNNSVTLILNREPSISAGPEIPVQVIDVDSGESYGKSLFVRAGKDLG